MCICTKMGIWSLLGGSECGGAALQATRTPGIRERTSRTYCSSTSIEALVRILPWAAANSGGLVVFLWSSSMHAFWSIRSLEYENHM